MSYLALFPCYHDALVQIVAFNRVCLALFNSFDRSEPLNSRLRNLASANYKKHHPRLWCGAQHDRPTLTVHASIWITIVTDGQKDSITIAISCV